MQEKKNTAKGGRGLKVTLKYKKTSQRRALRDPPPPVSENLTFGDLW